MRMIRHQPKSSDGWNNADIDVAFQLFACGQVWDGNVASKESRDHFVRHGYATRSEGLTSLTGRGIGVMLTTPVIWRSAWRRWRRWRRNPFVADEQRIIRART